MAGLTFGAELKGLKIFEDLNRQFPDMRVKLMGYIGSRGQEKLKKEFLSGQEINLKGNAYSLDDRGHRMISHWVLRGGRGVRISSYPVNLFETRQYKRGGNHGPGKNILKRKLKNSMNSALQGLADEYDKKFFQKEIDRITQ